MITLPRLLLNLSRLNQVPLRILQPLHRRLPLQNPSRLPILQLLPRLPLLQTPSRPPILQSLHHRLPLQTPRRLPILQLLPRLLLLQTLSRLDQAPPPIPKDPPLLLKILSHPGQAILRITQDLLLPLLLQTFDHPSQVPNQTLQFLRPHFLLLLDSHTSLAYSKYRIYISYSHPGQKGYIL